MLRFLFCLVAAASAYEIPVSRRAVLARVASAAPLAAASAAFADANNEFLGKGKDITPTADIQELGRRINKQDSKVIDDAGAAVQDKARFGASYASKNAPPRAKAGVRIGGKYDDPMHPGCQRKVTLIGSNKVLIEGADEGKTITVDFSPKGGPRA